MELLKVGLIGCGYWGRNYLRLPYTASNSRLEVVCDIDALAWSAFESLYSQISFVNNLDNFFEKNLDVVIVATPLSTHFEIVKRCLENNLHVLCEKPLCQTKEQVAILAALAKQNKLKLMVAHIFEYHPAINFISDHLSKNLAGNILFINMQRMGWGIARDDSSVIFDLAVHDISILLHLLKVFPTELIAVGRSYWTYPDIDTAVIQLFFPNNLLATINVSWLLPFKKRAIEIVGTKQTLVFNDISLDQKLKIFETGIDTRPVPSNWGSFQQHLRTGDIKIPIIGNDEPLEIQFKHFVNAVLNDTEPFTNGESGYNVVRILEAAERSISNNGSLIKII